MTRVRLRPLPLGTIPTPIPSDWDDEVHTCPICKEDVYGDSECCEGDRSIEAFAITLPTIIGVG